MEEYAPVITPIISATTNHRIDDPPKINTASNDRSVVSDVLIDRPMVTINARSITSKKLLPRDAKYSERSLSKITIVSFTESKNGKLCCNK
jgi:hypothetical protein